MGALNLSQLFILLKWMVVAFFWATLATLLDYVPGSYLFRPSKWCAWKVQDISASWLTTQLRKKKHIGPRDVVQRVEVQGLVIGGYMGLVNRLKIHYAKEPQKGAPQTLIVKQNSPGFKGRLISVIAGFIGEMKYYEELRDSVPIITPIFYHGQSFLEVDVLIIMSDVSDARPGPDSTKFTDDTTPLDLIRKNVKNLAKFQAKFWESKTVKKPTGYLARILDRDDRRSDILMRANVDKLWTLYGKEEGLFPSGWTKQDLLDHVNARWSIQSYMMSLPRVVVHSDFRLGNMLVKQEGDKYTCTIVDWQGHHISHPWRDLAYVITTDLPVETRHKVEKDLIKLYVKRLKKHGGPELDPEYAFKHYALGVLDYSLLVWCCGSAFVDMTNAEAFRQMKIWFGRSMTALDELKCREIAQEISGKQKTQ